MSLCRERIILTPRSETYCMRDWGHKGPCSPHKDPPPTKVPLPPKVAAIPFTPFVTKGGK